MTPSASRRHGVFTRNTLPSVAAWPFAAATSASIHSSWPPPRPRRRDAVARRAPPALPRASRRCPPRRPPLASSARRPSASRFALRPPFRELHSAALYGHRRRRLGMARRRSVSRSVRPPPPTTAMSLAATRRPPPRRGPSRPAFASSRSSRPPRPTNCERRSSSLSILVHGGTRPPPPDSRQGHGLRLPRPRTRPLRLLIPGGTRPLRLLICGDAGVAASTRGLVQYVPYCTRRTPTNYAPWRTKNQVRRSAPNQAGPSAGRHGRCADCMIRGWFRRAAAVGRAIVPLYFLASSKKGRFFTEFHS